MSVEILKPVIAENGIEFYVSNDGTEAGVSIAGLSRLCGTSSSTISDAIGSKPSEAMKTLLGTSSGQSPNVFSGQNGAKIITAHVATKLIKYFAFESKYCNDTAKHSLDKFLDIGFTTWVKQVTGFSTSLDLYNLNETLNLVLAGVRSTKDDVQALTKEVKAWRTVKTVADNHMKGLHILFEEIEVSEAEKEGVDYVLAPANERTWSLAEWLAEEKGILAGGLTKGKMIAIGRGVAESYKALKQQVSKKGYRKIGTNNALVAVYTKDDFPILHLAFNRHITA